MTHALGLDIGGTAVKYALVDPARPDATEIGRVPTPAPATPTALLDAIDDAAALLGSSVRSVGIGFCGPVRDGIVAVASNLDASWTGFDLAAAWHDRFGVRPVVLNDADAAARPDFCDATADERVLFVTFGTGVGTSLLDRGHVVDGLELGPIVIDGITADRYGSVRDIADDEWGEFAPRAGRVLATLSELVRPDRIVVGGGASERWAHWGVHLETDVAVQPARLGNRSGVVGAGLAALETHQ